MRTSHRSTSKTAVDAVEADQKKLLAEFQDAARYYLAHARLPDTLSAPVKLLIATDHELFRETVELLRPSA